MTLLDDNPLSAVLSIGKELIGHFFPDPAKAAEANLKLYELEKSGELQQIASFAGLDQGQQKINEVEAASISTFVSGWRPAIGWVCATALAVYFIPRILLGMFFWSHLAWTTNTLPPLPEMGIGDILGLTATLLGSSTIRMFEKKWGVARS